VEFPTLRAVFSQVVDCGLRGPEIVTYSNLLPEWLTLSTGTVRRLVSIEDQRLHENPKLTRWT